MEMEEKDRNDLLQMTPAQMLARVPRPVIFANFFIGEMLQLS